jgi:hypothetical protein
MDDAAFARVLDEADALVTLAIPNSYDPPPLIEKIRPRILIEQDPGYTHLWANQYPALGIFGRQDFYFTVGTNIGTDACRLPTHGIDWIPTWNPVVMEMWAGEHAATRDRFTTVAGWWDQGYLEYEGKVLGPKAEEFKKLIDVPRRAGESLEIALDIEPTSPDLALLREHGWTIEDPAIVATPAMYHDYITRSAGEFTVTKGGYAGTNCGWFSDRSACYLAAGKPVIVQATGCERLLPVGKGLLTFTNVEEAVEAIKQVRSDYAAHCRAAREIAAAHFDSDRVLSSIRERAGVH